MWRAILNFLSGTVAPTGEPVSTYCEDSPVPSVTRPLRKDAERNRLRILDAAREVFAEHGLTASLDQIAHHADVGVGTVYRRFPDKDALIDALFEQRMADFGRLAEAALEHEDAWEGLAHFLEQAVGMQAQDRGLKELLLSTGRGQERVAAVRDRIAPLVAQVVGRAKAEGALRADVVEFDVPMINMMLGTIADAARETNPELWRRYLALVLDGLRAERPQPSALPVPPLGADDTDRVMACWKPPRR
ncbi:MAG: transcriptional regulator, TetR family [Solirubrobacterales bacterium]|nr:transcriptional regulator, TetR family [Solirubrobacterales bacterium]